MSVAESLEENEKPAVGRLVMALTALAVLAALTWFLIDNTKMKAIPLALFALFAMKSVMLHVRKMQAWRNGQGG